MDRILFVIVTLSVMENQEENFHVLENKWVLSEQYYIENKTDRLKGYENSFEKLCVISTVETFWCFWKQIPAIAYERSDFVIC